MCNLNEQDIFCPSMQPSSEKKNAKNYFYYDVFMSVKLTLPTNISVVILAGGSIFLISPCLENRRIFKLSSPCLGLTSVHLIGIISISKSCIDFEDIFRFLNI